MPYPIQQLNTSQIQSSYVYSINILDAVLGALIRCIYKFIAFWVTYYCCLAVLDLTVFLPCLILASLAIVPSFLWSFYSIFNEIMKNMWIICAPFAAIIALTATCLLTIASIPVGVILGACIGIACNIFVWSMCIYSLYKAAERGANQGLIETLRDIFTNISAIPKYLNIVLMMAVTTYYVKLTSIRNSENILKYLTKCVQAEIDLYAVLGHSTPEYLLQMKQRLNNSESNHTGLYEELIQDFGWQMLGCEPEATVLKL